MKLYYKKERDRDFMRAYDEALKSYGARAPYTPRVEVVKKALNSNAGRFYITYEEARRNVRRLMNNRPLSCRNRNKLEMYEELRTQVEEYMKKHPRSTFNDSLFSVLSEGYTPRFYMGVQNALMIVYQHQRGGGE
ncbi:hypothetical protein [Coprobacter tertius]|uniref:CRISPR type III-B/RAMP module-associated protein Cmr5 n=1 Tax=Coprobacter tertius TaxID=2944915 RepID=A0ABT1MIX6_9BACT|nr:hypothetical protein [Coprobacter tertius]MCP9612565.1 hypothetical protein [Coprobacter tertius]